MIIFPKYFVYITMTCMKRNCCKTNSLKYLDISLVKDYLNYDMVDLL